MRAAPWIVAVVTAFSLAPGAHADVATVKTLDGVAPGTRVRIEGALSIRGSTPLTVLMLEPAPDALVTLTARTPDLDQELRSLDGLRVALEGEVLPPIDPSVPRLLVDRYELLTPPGGGKLVIGVIAMEDGACVLTDADGKRFWVVGDLAPALCQHAGARVWMVGKKTKGHGAAPRGATPFTPGGYGVINHSP